MRGQPWEAGQSRRLVRDTSQDAAPHPPLDRLIRLGATAEEQATILDQWAGMDAAGRTEAAAALDALSDSELQGELVRFRLGDSDITLPDGWSQFTVSQVVAWVDGDPARGAAALDAEEYSAAPRKTLVTALRLVLAG